MYFGSLEFFYPIAEIFIDLVTLLAPKLFSKKAVLQIGPFALFGNKSF
jgi:hypothetical protein